jgi:hypothetical protein
MFSPRLAAFRDIIITDTCGAKGSNIREKEHVKTLEGHKKPFSIDLRSSNG